MSKFEPYELIKHGLDRIMADNDLDATVEFSCFDKHTTADIYTKITQCNDNHSLSDFIAAFSSQPVFSNVDASVKYSTNTSITYEFNITMSEDSHPCRFREEYVPVSFECLSGVGAHTAQRLRDAGYPTIRDVSQEDLNDIQQMEGIGDVVIFGICDATGLTRPEEHGVPENSLDLFPVPTDRQKELLLGAGYQTTDELQNATNDELLNIDHIGRSLVYDIRNHFLPDDQSPSITRF